ncbi:MAG: DMT family transporter [Paracoccaceae bacterium]|nr:DMT family transporter [Paracoccaceae bacterium]
MTDSRAVPPNLRHATPADYGKIVATGAIWGSSFMLISVGLEGFPPFAVAALRVMIGAAALTAFGLLRGEHWPRGARVWLLIAIGGLLNTALPFSLIALGQQGVAAGRAAILMATVPFVTLLLSHFTSHDDRISGPKLFGLTLGVSGVILVVGLDALTVGGQSVAGQLAIMAAASCYAISNVITRKISHLPPVLGSAGFMLTASLYMGIGLLFFWWPETPPTDWRPWGAILALGIGPTAIAYVLRFYVIRDVGSTFMSQVGYLVPIFGIMWAWAVLGEVPALSAVGALALILLGIRVTQWKPGRARVKAPAD